MIRSMFLVLSVLTGGQLAAADNYKGTFDWLDMPEDSYSGKELTLSMTANQDGGFTMQMVARFKMGDGDGNPYRQLKDYSYSGDITGDLKKGPLTGTIRDQSGKNTWAVEVRMWDDYCYGIAKQLTGYKQKSWGTFKVSKVATDAPKKDAPKKDDTGDKSADEADKP